MTQFGMQMPGARARRADTMNIYTALMFIAFVALAVACGFMWQAASQVAPDGQPWNIQKANSINLPGVGGR